MPGEMSIKGPRRSPSVYADTMELDHICGMLILLNTDVDTSEVRYATVCARKSCVMCYQ